jgi:hypothetical protein
MDRMLNDVVGFEIAEQTIPAPSQLNELELALVGGGIGDTTL